MECSMHFTVQTWRPPGQQVRSRNSYRASVSMDYQGRQTANAA
jgi:hypothetical protein